MMRRRCSTADTLTDGCGCFRLRSRDVSESPMNYTQTGELTYLHIKVNTRQHQIRLYHVQLTVLYLVFSTAHWQREKPMKETFLLFATYVNNMTSEHAVQSPTVPGRGPTDSQLPQRTTQRGLLLFPSSTKTYLDSNNRIRGKRRWSRAAMFSSDRSRLRYSSSSRLQENTDTLRALTGTQLSF